MLRRLLLAIVLLAAQSPAWADLFPMNVVTETDWQSGNGRTEELLRGRSYGIVTFNEPHYFKEAKVLNLLDTHILKPERKYGRVTYIGIHSNVMNTRALSRRLKKLDEMGIVVIFIVKPGLFC